MSMEKISSAQLGEMMKLSADTLRNVTAQRDELLEKVAHYEKKERAERIASAMQEKGLEPEVPFSEKVAGLMKRDNLDVVEEAVSISAPQMKLASVHEDGSVEVEGHEGSDRSASDFASNLLSLE